MAKKKFCIPVKNIKRLIDDDSGCFATDKIAVEGRPVGYMYREPPDNDVDSGWRFMAGDETDEYMDDANNFGVYAVNSVANFDPDIIPFIDATIGSAFARNPETGQFEEVESPIDPDECLNPEFPVVTGDFELDADWAIFLPHKFNRRVEDGTLILWRRKVSIYVNAWNNDHDESISHRLKDLKSDISPNSFELEEQQKGKTQRISYRLVENGVNALYGFVVAEDGHLQVVIYFDNEADIKLARSLFNSITR